MVKERIEDSALFSGIKGRVSFNASLRSYNWFGVGGCAEIFFQPYDTKDLTYFLKNIDKDIAVTMLGGGSNSLIREGGIKGAVIRLGKNFGGIDGGIDIGSKDVLSVGAGAFSMGVSRHALRHGLGGLEFLSGIPGQIGGAIFMNSSAYGSSISDIIVYIKAVDSAGDTIEVTPSEKDFSYRCSHFPKDWIFTEAGFRFSRESKDEIKARIERISAIRARTQPVDMRSSGSAFINPEPCEAWRLIDKAGCRGLRFGDAMVSRLHSNFIVNLGKACAKDIEFLGEEVRQRVLSSSGIELKWEIRRLGVLGEE